MSNSFLYGTLSLLGVQFLAVIFGVLIYSRQKSAMGLEMRDRGIFKATVDRAMAFAQDAVDGVKRIDLEQYQTLARKLGEAHAEIVGLKAEIQSLRESILSCHNKLAARTRAENKVLAESIPSTKIPDKGDIEIPEGADPLEWMKANGVAMPMEGRVGFQQQTIPGMNGLPKGFGRRLGG
jgi:hypothetical protein